MMIHVTELRSCQQQHCECLSFSSMTSPKSHPAHRKSVKSYKLEKNKMLMDEIVPPRRRTRAEAELDDYNAKGEKEEKRARVRGG